MADCFWGLGLIAIQRIPWIVTRFRCINRCLNTIINAQVAHTVDITTTIAIVNTPIAIALSNGTTAPEARGTIVIVGE